MTNVFKSSVFFSELTPYKLYRADRLSLSCHNPLGMSSEKINRRFKDICQIGEGGSSSNQKFKIILISDIFRRGGGALSLCQNFYPCNFYIFFESHINILSFVIRILRTFLSSKKVNVVKLMIVLHDHVVITGRMSYMYLIFFIVLHNSQI